MLAGLVIEAAIVGLLLNVRFHVALQAGRPTTQRDDATPRITYLTLSSPAKRVTQDHLPRLHPPTSPIRSAASLLHVITVDTGSSHFPETVGLLRQAPVRSAIDSRISKGGSVGRSSAAVIDSIIRVGIQPGNDSLMRAESAREHAVDWTVGIDGERYGMSPGTLHLGKISLRAPVVFAEPLSLSSDRRHSSRLVAEDTRSHAARAIRDAMFDSAVASIVRRRGAGSHHTLH
jgi:hypothetical protein